MKKLKRMKIIADLFHLFYPKLCVICATSLLSEEKILCTMCRHDLPIIDETDFKNNKITQTFYGRVPVEKAMSFLYYRKEGKAKQLIHQLKYKGNQEIGVFLGNWFGENLKVSKEFSDIDCIVPVPLHVKKMKLRGYNQLTTFGERLSAILKTSYIEHELVRTSFTKTQTLKQLFERFNDAETKFEVIKVSVFENKHVLLIDDVITTGATLEACCKELLKAKNCKISIVTMAFTE